MENTFLAEAAKQGFTTFVLCVIIAGGAYIIRTLWAEVKTEREARINNSERVMTLMQEYKTVIAALTDAVRSR
jgi:cytochrome c-type biogenesis protein CcmH/NrfG